MRWYVDRRNWQSSIRSVLIISMTLAYSGCQHTPATPFDQGQQILSEANLARQESRQAIVSANKYRKQLSQLHSRMRKASTTKAKTRIYQQVGERAESIKAIQKHGAEQRKLADLLIDKARARFVQGMAKNFSSWINYSGSFKLADNPENTAMTMAHNSPMVTVHDNKRQLMANREVDDNKIDQDMSLEIMALSGQTLPGDLDISSYQLSRQKKLIAHIEVHRADALPVTKKASSLVPLNEIHQWRLILSDLEGRPVSSQIKVTGHMPGHVHGLPTQPRVTGQLAKGVYLVEGLKFQMRGWWVMEFLLGEQSNEQYEDSLRFHLVL